VSPLTGLMELLRLFPPPMAYAMGYKRVAPDGADGVVAPIPTPDGLRHGLQTRRP
jgi:hypothetical protein